MCKFLFAGLAKEMNKQNDKAPGCFPAAGFGRKNHHGFPERG
jgi:hypothetical protein